MQKIKKLHYISPFGAVMEIEETAKKIQTMEIRGAGRIARAAASALKDFAMQYQGNDANTLKIQLEGAASKLTNTRPTAVSLSNAITFTLKRIQDFEDIEALRNNVIESAEKFIEASNAAVAKISEIAYEIVPQKAAVLTHCNSSVVVSALIHAHNKGKKLKIFARETRPVYQGRLTAAELSQAGIPVTMIIDSAASSVINEVDMVMVGADTIEAVGNVVNKIGTSGLAVIAHESNIPFYVCAETYKFSLPSLSGKKTVIEERSPEEIANTAELAGVTIFNPVFDVTPAKYITNIICEKGIISTSDVEDIIKNSLT